MLGLGAHGVFDAGVSGPALIPRLKHELVAALRQAGYARIEDAVGTQAQHFAGST